eukprot:CAMPEP_0114415540 /NCGR_PEP_ID=MMETSP0103-20121206/1962_1 /TAXON_ID=37642 ORGANISM="Paraphysomonas imperforata, Strain PA2" /NCGR_SAMPLE_ID=MMETSP0103 /ASSEMBLY_ACC=CAM_ASM_000201 /LENGTH=888 /DNA_ID=CAMNT_0001583727 /DNA_START=55 /DNA_END=2721 /DNA_ORIENTATION=-
MLNPDSEDINTQLPSGVDDEVEEVWQNQSFIPFRGWGKPFTLMKEYTDRSGTQMLSNDLFPSVPLPSGWEWSTEWTVDIFGSFGAVDKDGWSYGVTWEGLFESIRDHCSVRENSPSSLCRRRRWIRIRKCVSVEVSELLQDQTEEELDVMVSLEKSLFDKTQDYEHVMQYEQERKKIYEQVTSTCLADILVVYQSFLEYQRVLRLLHDCLAEQAALESQYAQALGAHASKFAALLAPPDSNPPAPTPPPAATARTPQRSASMALYNTIGAMEVPPVTTPDTSQDQQTNSSTTDKEELTETPRRRTSSGGDQVVNMMKSQVTQTVDDIGRQFFSTMNKFNTCGSQKWTEYSNFIGSSVMEDISELLTEVTNQLDVAKRYVYWSDVNAAPILSKLESSVVLLQHTYFASAKKIKTKMERINSKLFVGGDSSGPTTTVEVSDVVKAGRRSSLSQRRSSVGLSTEGEAKPSETFPLPPSLKVKVDDELVLDMWTCMKSYRKNVIRLGNELSLLGLTAQKCVSKEKDYARAVRHLFLASAQVLSHEKARICMEMGEIMNNERKHFVSLAAEQEKHQAELEGGNSNVPCGSPSRDATLIYTPATELPKFHNQILLMSIMQYTTLAEAKRVNQLENDPNSPKPVSKEAVLSIKAVVTTDGVLHIFLLEEKDKSTAKKTKNNEDTPFRSLLLEDCKIVRHFGEDHDNDKGGGHISSSFENAVEVHPRNAETDWFGTRKNEALMLIPIDSMESETWVDVLTNPLCGAGMLYSALGDPTPSRRSSSVYSRRASLQQSGEYGSGRGSRSSSLLPPVDENVALTEQRTEHNISPEKEQEKEQEQEQTPFSHPSSTKMSSLFPSVDIPSNENCDNDDEEKFQNQNSVSKEDGSEDVDEFKC